MPTRVDLAPLFPRPIALYVGITIIAVCWILPFRYETDAESTLLCILLGLTFLLVLFVPKLGFMEFDAKRKTVLYQEGAFARLLHPWRKREQRQIELAFGDEVTIGEWLDRNAFATLGVKVTNGINGNSIVLLQQRFAFTSRGAASIAKAVREMEGVNVKTVRLDQQFKPIPWEPSQGDDRRPK